MAAWWLLVEWLVERLVERLVARLARATRREGEQEEEEEEDNNDVAVGEMGNSIHSPRRRKTAAGTDSVRRAQARREQGKRQRQAS